MRGALPYVVYNFFRKCAFSHKDMHPFTCALDTLSEIRFYTHTCTKKNHSVVKNRKKQFIDLFCTQHMGEHLTHVTKLKFQRS